MLPENLLFISIKLLLVVLLLIYMLIAILIARQIILMNKAIKTKLSGILNLIGLIHIGLVFIVLIVVLLIS